MPDQSRPQEIIHVLGAASPQAEEQIASVASVLQSWGYAVRAIGPLTRMGRRMLAGAGIATTMTPEPTGESVAARWSDARELARIISETAPLLVHAHGLRAGLSGLLARRGLSGAVPVVASPHLRPYRLSEDPRLGLRRRGYRWVLNHADAIIVPTETQRDDLGDLDAAAAERAELVPYAYPAGAQPDSLDLGRRRALLGITQSAVVVGCAIDDLAPEALAVFLDAGASVCMEYPSLEFALIGSDADDPKYQQLAHERGLLGATVFVNPHDRFRRAISALNVLVTPQRGWPSGMLALQALAAEVGVVAIEGGEVDEMLGRSPRVTIAAADGAAELGEGIIRRLRAAAAQMEPERDLSAPTGAAAVSLLVSKDFYDIGETWATPAARKADASGRGDHGSPPGDFHPTRAARALIAVYQRLLGAD
ncbi:MAG: glycosyltransferase [Armatimonadota bacterium]